jgi:ADP-ribose pyrophosphatase
MNEKIVYRNEWFEVEEERLDGWEKPYYRIKTPEAVVIFALTKKKEVILVRQYRPAIRSHTLELPAGGVHEDESFLEAAKRELKEETGYVSNNWEEIGSGRIMMDRFTGKLHSFLARNVELKFQPQEKIETSTVPLADFKKLVLEGKFEQFGALGIILLADWKWQLFHE